MTLNAPPRTHTLTSTYSLPTEVTQALEDATHEMLLAMPALPTGVPMCNVCGNGVGGPLWTNDHPSIVCLCGDDAEPGDIEPIEPHLLMDIEPTLPRDPFAPGALLPMSVETKNSWYSVYAHALLVDAEPTCTVMCERGTFAGQSWTVRTSEVHLTRTSFRVDGEAGLRTTAPIRVNGYDVAVWG